MKCEDCLTIIEEYFDAELNGRESAKVADHLIACSTCNEVYESLQQEQQLYVHYQRDVEVTAALWQGVQASIRQQAARQVTVTQVGVVERLRRFFTETFHAPRFSPALAAMLVVIAIGATVVVMKVLNSTPNQSMVAGENTNATTPSTNSNQSTSTDGGKIADGGNQNVQKNTPPEKKEEENNTPEKKQYETPSNQPQLNAVKHTTNAIKPSPLVAKDTPNATAEDLLRDAELKYIKAIVLLERDFDKRRSKLDPKLVAKLDGSLASIDRTIAETRKAVRQNPGDPIALQYMLTAYAKKVEVLKDVTAN